VKDVAQLVILLLALACLFALPAAVVAQARRESHPQRRPLTLPEQADRWTGGDS
jgi:hypothetical protein